MSRALVVGCGYVGGALAERLREDGREVWALRRRPRPGDDAIRWLSADVGDERALTDALAPLRDGQPLEVHYLVSAGGFDDAAYQTAYVHGPKNVLSALEGAAVRRVVFAGSTAVYGQTEGEWVDEESPTEPTGFSGRRLLEGEALLAAAPMETVSVRFGGIYGPGRTRLIDQIAAGKAIADPDGPQFRSRMHRDDCARTMRHLGRITAPAARYLGVDDEPTDQRDVQAWLCERLGVEPAGLTPTGAARRGGNKRCRNARLRATGLELRFPTYREGYGALLSDLGLGGAGTVGSSATLETSR